MDETDQSHNRQDQNRTREKTLANISSRQGNELDLRAVLL
jgi:hypothetical protein